jgi:predicted phage-related endonuclease
MRQGRDLEDYVAQRFMEATGKKVRRANAMFYDEQHPFMLADVDRMIVGENAGLECKTASPYVADQWADGKIPLSYQIQCHHYMRVMQTDVWYIAALIYGNDFKFYRIERDEKLLADLTAIEQDFWENNVMKRVIPDPDGSRAADDVLAAHYRQSNKQSIPLVGFEERLKRREELVKLKAQVETEQRRIEQELKLYMGESESAQGEGYRVTWKSIITNRLDTDRLKAEQPEIFREYQKPSASRRLTIKAA